MKKFFLLLSLSTAMHTYSYCQGTHKVYRSCRQVLDSILLTSPYVNDLVTPWEEKIKASGGLGWDYVLDASPVFSDLDPLSGTAYNEDYVFLLRATYKDSAAPVYTFKVKPSNGKLYELDKAKNVWIQRKSDPALMPILVSLCK